MIVRGNSGLRLSTDVLFTYLVGWLVGLQLASTSTVRYPPWEGGRGRGEGRDGDGHRSGMVGTPDYGCWIVCLDCRTVGLLLVVGRSVVSTWGREEVFGR